MSRQAAGASEGARSSGRIEPHRPVDAIQVGCRHRVDLGDLGELCASIQRLGLLQPITISLDGTLLCGARRLAAVKLLGWQAVKVWVRSGLSGRLERLLAEQEENNHKPFTPTEAAALYRELKTILAEEAARRQETTRFGADSKEGKDGKRSGKSAGQPGGVKLTQPRAREQAARLVTGRTSYNTLERVGEIERIASDDAVPETIRTLARDELAAMDADGNVNGHYTTVKAAINLARLEQTAANPDLPSQVRRQAALELDQLEATKQSSVELKQREQEALTQVKAARPDRKAVRIPEQPSRDRKPRTHGPRRFIVFWSELHCWTDRYDPAEIGPALTDEQWASFETTVQATVVFADQARQARIGQT